jgi:hypothetical protein
MQELMLRHFLERYCRLSGQRAERIQEVTSHIRPVSARERACAKKQDKICDVIPARTPGESMPYRCRADFFTRSFAVHGRP